ncbi:MAG: cell wall-binding repeat-containing protein, partial [Candidatus Syntrophonatronum acetioxidans]
TRIETAALIAEEAAEAGDLADYAFVVNGFAPADSLAAGPAAFENNAPILQVREGSVPSVTEDVLEALGIDELFVVGGTAVVSAAVFNQLDDMASVSRLAGADRYETSIEVAKEMYPDAVDYSIVGGFNYADAIGAAVFANPILFVRQDAVPSSVDAYLDDVLTSASILTIFGGTVAVSSGVEDALKAKFVDIPVEFEITDVSALTERGHHARIDFNMAIANISADDIEVIEDATGDELGVKNASTARAGRAANVEFFADDDEVILERGERYIFTVSVAEGTSTYEYVRSYTETGRIVDVDHEDNELRVRYEDDDDFKYKWIEVPDDYDIDLEYILARELRVWFDGDDVLTRHTVESEDVKYDALELIDDEEIELVYEDEEYDFDDEVMDVV